MARCVREFDWSDSSLGPPEQWSAALKTVVGLLLRSKHPTLVLWGPELLCIYNDAYSASLGVEKHPTILGTPVKDAFPEIWSLVGEEIRSVYEGGPSTWHENQLVPLVRNGRLEEVYWTYSYAGIDDEAAESGIGGVLVLCTETTAHVLERKRANTELAKFVALFDQAPFFLAVLSGAEHRFEFVNPAYQRLVAGRDVVGKTVRDALPEVVAQGYPALLDGVFRSGKPHMEAAAEVHLLTDNGSFESRRLDFAYQPVSGADGRTHGVLVIGVDVTESFEAKKALALREEQLRLATEASDVGLWDVDPIFDTLYWPPSVRAMFGIFSDREVTMHGDFFEALHPDDRAHTSASYANACDPARRTLYDVEYRTIGREDGKLRWVAAKGRGLFDESGRCIRVIGTAIDITSRKRDEARLVQLNEILERRVTEFSAERKLFADIVEGTDALIQVVDLEFKILASNIGNTAEFERLYGVKPRVGDNLLNLLENFPSHKAEVESIWQRALRGQAFVEERELGLQSLRRRWFELHFHPLYATSGQLIGAYQFGYDITSRREAETRLADAEAALIQAQRMEAVGLMAGGVAHDFNNVLQALSAKFELIRRKPDDPEKVRTWAASGFEGTRKGARVTAQLLAFSRRQTGAESVINVRELIDNVTDLLRTTLGPEIELQIYCDDLCVKADRVQLEMALLNLAVNSKDAMPHGGVFALRVRLSSTNAAYVDLCVSDTGTGMSPEVLKSAFTPFFTTKGLGKGSGLGLAQVYAMATRAGGNVKLESDGKTGTAVRISLPWAAPEKQASAAAVGEDSAQFPGLSILVVDDDSAVRKAVVELLQSLGHRVHEASGGEDALSALETFKADIMLCDYAMPGMNGVAVASLARAAHPDLAIIFMSGYENADELSDVVGQHATLLRKPFDANTVQRAIAALRHSGLGTLRPLSDRPA